MDIEKERLKIPCPNCQSNIIITYRTRICPICEMQFNTNYIQEIFHDYETRLLNNKYYQASERLEKFGDTTKKVGDGMSKVGCFMTIFITIPIIIFLMLLLF